jgi:hypothetical protein
MDPTRKQWNERQQALQDALTKGSDHHAAVDLFFTQHGMVHSSQVQAVPGQVSFDDDLWQGLSEAAARIVPSGADHSIAWMMWHTARCEDITMNLLVAGSPQVLNEGGWTERMGLAVCDTGNAMDPAAFAAFKEAVQVQAVRDYRTAVGRRTREIVQALAPGAFKQKMDPARLDRVFEEGAVVKEAAGLVEYWGGRTVAGLLLMPATRHNLVHINEAERVKKKVGVV